MAFKLIETTQKKWLRLRGYQRLADVITGVKFANGIKQTGDQQQEAACFSIHWI
jgi:putative transposase